MRVTKERLPGARIDTAKPIAFHFDGRPLKGYAGDTLASALLANGYSIVGRSFKLHRPRGIFGAGKEEVNALVQLEGGAQTEPNARATLVSVYQGLKAHGQNAFPSVCVDFLGLLGAFKRALPASFYYKTFMWPSWHAWEWVVRRVAGLGRAPDEGDPDRYIKQNVHAEVVIVGGGRSGLSAALDAAETGSRVLLLDEQDLLGGALLASQAEEDRQWLASAVSRLEALPNVTVRCSTTVNGYYDNNVLAAVERRTHHRGPHQQNGLARECLWRIYAGRVILATGAIERPLVFPNNDRPGIMLASAVREYTNRYGLTLGDKVVFYANNDSAWHVALDLVARGIGVNAIIDIRGGVDKELRRQAKERGIEVYLGTAISDTRGRRGIKSVKLAKLSADGTQLLEPVGTLRCDLLAMSGGWTPTIHLYSQSGGVLRYCEEDACFIPKRASQNVEVVGRAAGNFPAALNLQAQWLTPDVSPEYQWVDFQYDVTASDIQLAARENFVSVEHVKRYTTNGMSVDQGKTSNVNGLGILAQTLGRPIPEVGTTRFRPPYHPSSIGAFVGIERGDLYTPYQRLPAHGAHEKAGAEFEDYGAWKRPAYYPLPGESEEQALSRESLAVRNSVGLLDYSPLGKLEIHGPDAREFLNRVYINNIKTLKVGAARYGLMLNEAGIVIDDGVMVCLADDRFLLHTTSGGATSIHQHLEEWLQCEWLDLQVIVNNVTTQWGTLMLSGPRSRAVLEKLPSDIKLSKEQFAHMQYREGTLCGAPCRILRASFTGEVSFEISVPARQCQALWEALMEAGAEEGIVPFGIESLMLLRTEKGYLHVGADTDGTTMPQDLGWARAIERKADDFIGRRTLAQEVGMDARRFQFTGLELMQPCTRVESGAHVLNEKGDSTEGYVTSAFFSPTLNRTVALGIVAGAHDREGSVVRLLHEGEQIAARLVKPCAFDAEGERLNA